MGNHEPEISKEERELLRLLDGQIDIPPLPEDFDDKVLSRLSLSPNMSTNDEASDNIEESEKPNKEPLTVAMAAVLPAGTYPQTVTPRKRHWPKIVAYAAAAVILIVGVWIFNYINDLTQILVDSHTENERLVQSVKVLEGHINVLEEENKKLRKSEAEKYQETMALRLENEKISEDIEKFKAQFDNLSSSKLLLSKKFEAYRAENKKTLASVRKYRDKYRERIKVLEANNLELREADAEFRKAIQHFQQEVESNPELAREIKEQSSKYKAYSIDKKEVEKKESEKLKEDLKKHLMLGVTVLSIYNLFESLSTQTPK